MGSAAAEAGEAALLPSHPSETTPEKAENQSGREKTASRNKLMSVLAEPFEWLQLLSSQMSPSFVFGVILVYGLSQGFSGSYFRVVPDFYWKDVRKVQPSTVQLYLGFYYIPSVMKPVWGILTDVFPIRGYKRKPYFVVAGVLGCASALTVASVAGLPATVALGCLVGVAAGMAIADVTIDACIAKNSIEMRALAPDMQSLCGFCSSAGALVGYSTSGFFVHHLGPQGALGLLVFPPACFVVLGFVIYEIRSADLTSSAGSADSNKFFTKQEIGGNCRAICNGCKRSFVGGPKSGTSHLKNHIDRCPNKKFKVDMNQVMGSNNQANVDGKMTIGNYTFDEKTARRDLTQMIVLHEYPLSIVDHVGFRKYSSTLQPLFKVPSRRTIRRDILRLHKDFKKQVMSFLDTNEGRIAITTDMWTSDHHKKGYMAVTAHFIDNTWSIQKRIIRFEYVPAPHTKDVIVKHLMDCLLDWNLDRKLSTITVDNCSVNDGVVRDLVGKISDGSLLLNGNFFHMRCCAHILNLIVKSGLDVIEDSIEKIRDSVLFWTASPKRVEKFEELAHQLKIPTNKKLSIDCKTRWNSTYLMLVTAINYKKVFERCEKRDIEPGYKIATSEVDWDRAALISEKLKLFYLVTEKFSGTKYPTANLYFPNLCKIRLALRGWILDPSPLISEMAKDMMGKYEKYWADVQGIMGVATLLDPRYKRVLLRYYFEKLYEKEKVDEEVENIVQICSNLLREYEMNVFQSPVASTSSVRLVDEEENIEDVPLDYDNYALMNRRGRSGGRSELERFLDADVVPRDPNFDILDWWKINGPTFPVLQKIAKDIYAIPVSTVASESAFSTGGRLVSPHRNRLQPIMVEALACTQNWLQAENKVLLEKILSSPQIFLEDIEECDKSDSSGDEDLNVADN